MRVIDWAAAGLVVCLSAIAAASSASAGDWPQKAGGVERPEADASAGGAPARDGDVAIRQEFEAAAEAGSIDAYRRFAWRHPDHPLSAVAKARIEALIAGR